MNSKADQTNNEMPDQKRQEPVNDNSIGNISDDIMHHNNVYDEQMENLHQEYIKDSQVKYERWSATSYFLFEWFRDKQYDNIEEYTNHDAAFGNWQDFDYAEKLKYVDHVSKCYYVGFHDFCPENTFFSIKPDGLSEKVAYNKWVIDHWREWFQSGSEVYGPNDFPEIYDNISLLQGRYSEWISKLDKVGKPAFMGKELNVIKSFIQRSNVEEGIVNGLLAKFRDNLDEHIYHRDVTTASVWTELRNIGKVWDMLKYQVLLENEQSTLIVKQTPSFNVFFNHLSEAQIGSIYNFLVTEKYIAEDTDIHWFAKLLGNEEVPDSFFIKWIDAPNENKEVTKFSLFEFVDLLLDVDDEDRRHILKRYFKTFRITNQNEDDLRDINKENLKNSWSRWLSKKKRGEVSFRQQQIVDYIKSVWDS